MKKLLIISLVALFVACSSDDDSTTSDSNDNNNNTNDPGLLVRTISYDDETDIDDLTITFTYDGNKLIKSSGTGSANYLQTFDYTYENNQLKYIDGQWSDDFTEGTSRIELNYVTDDYITIALDYGIVDSRSLTFNADGTITKSSNAGAGGLSTSTFTLDSNSNVISEDDDDPNDESLFSYTYDTKNGAFKNVHQIDLLNLLSEDFGGIQWDGNQNNVIYNENTYWDGTTDSIVETIFIYNEHDYPVSAVEEHIGFDANNQEEAPRYTNKTYTYY